MHFITIDDGFAVQASDGTCQSNEPGHCPHSIQIRKALEVGGEAVSVVASDLSLVLTGLSPSQPKTFFTHNPQNAADLASIHGSKEFLLVEEFSILLLPTGLNEGFAFSLSRSRVEGCQ